jgi:hypothetical protein
MVYEVGRALEAHNAHSALLLLNQSKSFTFNGTNFAS